MTKKDQRYYLVITHDTPVSEEFRFTVAMADTGRFCRLNTSDFHSGKYCRDEWEIGRYIAEQERKRLAAKEAQELSKKIGTDK